MKILKTYLLVFSLFQLNVSWANAGSPEITKKFFGMTAGQDIFEYTLTNSSGVQVKVISYGASITDIITPDRDGHLGSVVFGFDSLADYTGTQNALMGAIVGRVANRIANSKFVLEGKEYQLSSNIHGGKNGFDKKLWKVQEIKNAHEVALKMDYFSRDGEEGYPGNLNVSVTYTLTNKSKLRIEYKASSDRPTHVNLTNHSYFNLSGGKVPTVVDTRLRILSNAYLETNSDRIPTGNILKVAGTPFDFSTTQPIGKWIAQEDTLLKMTNGYDLTYVLHNQSGKLKFIAEAYEPISGRVLKAFTTEPGLVFYTGNHLNPGVIGRGKKPATKYAAFCLETQHYPNAPNQPKFPSTLLLPGQTYYSKTEFEFGVNK